MTDLDQLEIPLGGNPPSKVTIDALFQTWLNGDAGP